jgi:hypothetical protein
MIYYNNLETYQVIQQLEQAEYSASILDSLTGLSNF